MICKLLKFLFCILTNSSPFSVHYCIFQASELYAKIVSKFMTKIALLQNSEIILDLKWRFCCFVWRILLIELVYLLFCWHSISRSLWKKVCRLSEKKYAAAVVTNIRYVPCFAYWHPLAVLIMAYWHSLGVPIMAYWHSHLKVFAIWRFW